MKPIKTDMQSVLALHIGKNNGITAKMLAGVLACSEREVRTLITELRLDGVAVCGTPSTGYYIAATGEELEETCQYLRTRAMHSLMLESKLRRVPLPDLLGQMRLRT